MTCMKKKIAVILCGSGYLDGSEIREAVGVLWALSEHPVEVECFAPNSPQSDVMNCLTAEPLLHETRNQLTESARIARGKVRALDTLKPAEFDGLIFPGGYGAAKNLCTFAKLGSRGTVTAEVQNVIDQMHARKKPIGAVCIAPAILALGFKDQKFELTVGSESEASQEIEKLGHRHIVCKANECHVDKDNRIVTTPAYMYDSAPLHEIFEGIRKLVGEVVKLA